LSTLALDGGYCQFHATVMLCSRGNKHRYPLDRRLDGPRAGLDTEVRGNVFRLCRGSKLDRPVFQSYTDWATRLTHTLDR
jgi:hypothetical protein